MSNYWKTEAKPKRLWLKIGFGVLLILIVSVGGYALSIYNGMKEAINAQMYQPVPSINQVNSEDKVFKEEPINVLFLGINKQDGDRGRADSLFVLSLNPKANSTKLIGIPRDTRALIVGKESEDKINHAYAYGGPDMAIGTVENLLDIQLDYYFQMNLAGVPDLIDGLGGITINNELDIEIEEPEFKLTPGELDLSGTQAYRFVEILSNYQGEDIDSSAIQDRIFGAIIEKGTTPITINKIETIAGFLGDNLTTNIDVAILEHLLENYTNVGKNFSQYMLSGSKTEIDEVNYLIISDEEIEKVQQMIEEPGTEI